MNEIIKYLNNPVFQEDIQHLNSKALSGLKDAYDQLNTSLLNESRQAKSTSKVMFTEPKENFEKGEIWLVKKNYVDYEGHKIKSDIPHYVCIVTDVSKLSDIRFARVQPLSQFTEFCSPEDILIKDQTIIGFEFIIESWNEQPISVELLDKRIGSLPESLLQIDSSTEKYTYSKEQVEFRKCEIQNTKYIRNSILAYLSWNEHKQEDMGGVVFNFDNSVYYPELVEVMPDSMNYQAAAKSGMNPESHIYAFEQDIDSHKVEVEVFRHDKNLTILVKTNLNIELLDTNSEIIEPTMLWNDKNIFEFSSLSPGQYNITTSSTQQTIGIRIQ